MSKYILIMLVVILTCASMGSNSTNSNLMRDSELYLTLEATIYQGEAEAPKSIEVTCKLRNDSNRKVQLDTRALERQVCHHTRLWLFDTDLLYRPKPHVPYPPGPLRRSSTTLAPGNVIEFSNKVVLSEYAFKVIEPLKQNVQVNKVRLLPPGKYAVDVGLNVRCKVEGSTQKQRIQVESRNKKWISVAALDATR